MLRKVPSPDVLSQIKSPSSSVEGWLWEATSKLFIPATGNKSFPTSLCLGYVRLAFCLPSSGYSVTQPATDFFFPKVSPLTSFSGEPYLSNSFNRTELSVPVRPDIHVSLLCCWHFPCIKCLCLPFPTSSTRSFSTHLIFIH